MDGKSFTGTPALPADVTLAGGMTTDAPPPNETASRAETRHPILQLLAQNVRGARKVLGWSMKAAAERSGVARGTIKNIEAFRSNPGASILFRLANGFGLTFADLIDPTLLTRLPKAPVSYELHERPRCVAVCTVDPC